MNSSKYSSYSQIIFILLLLALFLKIVSTNDFQTYYYNQTLDHFNYGPQCFEKFPQKYIVNFKHWGGPNSNSPIFAYLGAEAPLDSVIKYIGIINDNAPNFQALSIFMEHRFYGESVPFGWTMDEAIENETIRGYFNSAQALADYAELLLHIKQEFSAQKSPIIVFGGSYGGMLASWFRLKYPHVALGALAVSAPILLFDNIVSPQNEYFSIVTKDFMETSMSCYESIKSSWAEFDRIASISRGLSNLSELFKTCSQLSSSNELKEYLVGIYTYAAQYNYPQGLVRKMCEGIDGAPAGTDLIGRIYAGVVSQNFSFCLNTNMAADEADLENIHGWRWQRCSEMVMPIGREESDTMFEASPFNLTQFSQDCEQAYGITPRPHWITTYYGGHDIKLVLKSFGSNIIFSNGLRDPYSSGGVLEDISESIVAVNTLKGSYCLDMIPASKHDPQWLVAQRNKELVIIRGWLKKYYANLIDEPNTAAPLNFHLLFFISICICLYI